MYDRPLFYLTFGGVQLTGAEIWQSGVHFAAFGGEGLSDYRIAMEQISLSDVYEDLGEIFSNATMGARYPASTRLDWCKLSLLNPDGTVHNDPLIHEQVTAGTVQSSNAPPPQLAMVVSLWSGSNFGKANHGRMYLPMPVDHLTAVEASTGKVALASTNALRDKVNGVLNQVEGEISTIGTEMRLVIASKLGTGATKEVEHIAVGRIVDTQRRRRNALPEDPVYADYIGAGDL